MTLDTAIKEIEKLKKENASLREELEYYKNRKMSGRQKHNAKWQAVYDKFAAAFEQGLSIDEVALSCNISRRTAYRYKAHYDMLNGNN